MCEELIKMINDKSLTVQNYFKMAPYIASIDTQYRNISRQINFFDEFNVVTDKTFLHLTKLAKVAMDDSTKLLVLTGYCGTGKSNFLRFCESIIKNESVLKDYNQVLKDILQLYSFEKKVSDGIPNNEPDFFDEEQRYSFQNEIKTLEKNFSDSLSKIQLEQPSIWYNQSKKQIEEKVADYLNKNLCGDVIFFDFDADKRDDNEPLETKLTRQIEENINGIKSPVLIESVYTFYKNNKDDITRAFENRCDYFLEKALKILYNNRNKSYDSYKRDFLQVAKKLDIDQLLCIVVFLGITKTLNSNTSDLDRVYYIFDNIDMISGPDNAVFIKTIGIFWNFIVEMQSLMHSLSIKEEHYESNINWINTYSKFKYIFAMRETTSMHIGDHLRTIISSFAEHIDVSLDVNKSFVLKKRYNLLSRLINSGKITNESFINAAESFKKITEDKFFKWTFFSLLNNDYRSALNCLYEICKDDSTISPSFSLLNRNEPYMKFGGRGIIIKTLCDIYKRGSYFKRLKIPYKGHTNKNVSYDITLIRIILTVLRNLTKEKVSVDTDTNNTEFPFFVLPENSVSLKDLFEEVAMFCGDTEESQKNNFLNCLSAMFSARSWNYWNHLVTFDNIPKYNFNEFWEALKEGGSEKEIYIRCTKAGEQYLKTLCVHFEFFACRYGSQEGGLFSGKNYKKSNNKYQFEDQIAVVYKKVASCCAELKRINETMINKLNYTGYNDLLESHYVVDRKFHEERIIHNHISYLDAFRMYLINGPLKKDIVNVNTILIEYINDYLNLLKYSDSTFYSKNSEALYRELNSCIELIRQNEYNDTSITISRDYYKNEIQPTLSY